MAKCPNCEGVLADNGNTCPHCGADTSWWLAREGEVYGPYDLATVRFVLADNRATLRDLAMIGRQTQWRPLGELLSQEDIATAAVQPAPVTTPGTSERAPAAKPEPKYRNWSVRGWLLYVLLFILGCGVAAWAITWPTYAKVSKREAARQSESNLEQIGLALQLYAHDHDGRLPQKGKWEQAVAHYLPDAEAYRTRVGGKEESYWYNDRLAGGDPQQWSNHAKLVLAAEPGAFEEPQPAPPRPEGFMYLYADGSVAAHPPGHDFGQLEPRTPDSR